MTRALTPEQVARLRLQSQSLVASPHTRPVDAVRAMLAMQAQDFPASQWAIGARVPGSTRDDVVAAYDSGQIVRSWPMRGTLHVTAAEDLGWMLDLTAERTLRGMASRHRQLGLDGATFDRARDITIGVLAGGRRAVRRELLYALQAGGVSTEGQRGAHCIGQLAHTGVVCWGPVVDSQQALVLLDEWVPEPRRLDRPAALAEYVRRFVAGRGPASVADFAWWSKLTLSDARAGFAAVREELQPVICGDAELWMTLDAFERLDPDAVEAEQSVLALPAFDELLLGYRDRSASLAPGNAERIVPGGNGMFRPTSVAGGRVIGTWRRAVTRTKATLTHQPFGAVDDRITAGFGSEAARYGAFLGVPTCVA